jgi:hypothetical protein
MKWMKSMGQRLVTGNVNVLNTPFPVDMFEPRSYLEKLADVWVYPRYLREAAQASSPVERMKMTMTWFIAGAAGWGGDLGREHMALEGGRPLHACMHACGTMYGPQTFLPGPMRARRLASQL